MDWTIEFEPQALKQLSKLDRTTQRKIRDYLRDLRETDYPTQRGKGLTGNRSGTWRYRVGHYRILCHIKYNRLVVLVIKIAHRSTVYE